MGFSRLQLSVREVHIVLSTRRVCSASSLSSCQSHLTVKLVKLVKSRAMEDRDAAIGISQLVDYVAFQMNHVSLPLVASICPCSC